MKPHRKRRQSSNQIAYRSTSLQRQNRGQEPCATLRARLAACIAWHQFHGGGRGKFVIVGRTGSGKSTTALAFFRFVILIQIGSSLTASTSRIWVSTICGLG